MLSILTILSAIISISAVPGHWAHFKHRRETFSATLSGKEEVPPTDSSATGWAKFQTNDNGTQVSYWINLTGLNEITGAHIHNGSAG